MSAFMLIGHIAKHWLQATMLGICESWTSWWGITKGPIASRMLPGKLRIHIARYTRRNSRTKLFNAEPRKQCGEPRRRPYANSGGGGGCIQGGCSFWLLRERAYVFIKLRNSTHLLSMSFRKQLQTWDKRTCCNYVMQHIQEEKC